MISIYRFADYGDTARRSIMAFSFPWGSEDFRKPVVRGRHVEAGLNEGAPSGRASSTQP
jgi:hypothetical protein